MRNFVQPGRVLTMVAGAGGVTSGSLQVVGAIFGIAATSAEEDAEYELSVGGVYELPKVSAEVWTVGAEIYATSAGIATAIATGNTKIGVAVAETANPSGSGLVRLNDNF